MARKRKKTKKSVAISTYLHYKISDRRHGPVLADSKVGDLNGSKIRANNKISSDGNRPHSRLICGFEETLIKWTKLIK